MSGQGRVKDKGYRTALAVVCVPRISASAGNTAQAGWCICFGLFTPAASPWAS